MTKSDRIALVPYEQTKLVVRGDMAPRVAALPHSVVTGA
jgi:hypothetical protein